MRAKATIESGSDRAFALRVELACRGNSGYSDEQSGWLANQQHKCIYLPKPYSLEDLLKSVRSALGKRGEPQADQ
ncbi:MAG: hypothetical protein Q8Q12_04730 [bacterium]|nr:hypothetical protein [bacterium]